MGLLGKKETLNSVYYLDTVQGVNGNNLKAASILRAALSFISVLSLLICIVTAYELPVSILPLSIITLVVFIIVYISISLRRFGVISLAALFAIIGVMVYLSGFYKRIASAFEYAINYCLFHMNDGLLSTHQYMTIPFGYFQSEIVRVYLAEFNVFMAIIAVLITLIFVICLHGKPAILPCILIVAAFLAPAILAALIPSTLAFVLLISSLVAQLPVIYGVRVGNLSSKSVRKSNKQQKSSKKSIITKLDISATKKKNRFKEALRVYNRHGFAAMLCVLICLISFAVSSIIIPSNSYFSFEKLIDKATEMGEGVADRFGHAFGIIDNSLFIGGGNSASNISMTDLLSVRNPSTSERQVLKVTTDEAMQVFLRSSIGVNFENNGWTSISRNHDEEYRKLLEQGFQTEDSAENFLRIANNEFYATEHLFAAGFNRCNVAIQYLAPSSVMFLPVSTYGVDMLSSKLIDIWGDTTAKLKTVSTDTRVNITALIPHSTSHILHTTYNSLYPIYNSLLSEIDDRVNNEGYLLENVGTIYYGDSGAIAPSRFGKYCYLEGQYGKMVRKYYLDVPDKMESEIYELAVKVTEGSVGPYEQAIAIHDYLKKNYSYSLDPQDTKSGYDDVRNFLFISKQGHCALYASSMVLMARSMGIPARYAAGFSADTRSNLSLDGENYVILKESNFHAWAEIYLDGIGWLPFDPTGISRDNVPQGWEDYTTQPTTTTTTAATSQTSKSTTKPIPSSSNTNLSTQPSGESDNNTGIPKSALMVIFILLVTLLPALAISFTAQYANHKQQRKHNSFKQVNANTATQEMYRYILKMLKLAKYEPQPSELPHDFAQRVDKAMFMLNADVNFSKLIPVFERREFGNENSGNVTEQERKDALKYLNLLYDDIVNRSSAVRRILFKIRL